MTGMAKDGKASKTSERLNELCSFIGSLDRLWCFYVNKTDVFLRMLTRDFRWDIYLHTTLFSSVLNWVFIDDGFSMKDRVNCDVSIDYYMNECFHS